MGRWEGDKTIVDAIGLANKSHPIIVDDNTLLNISVAQPLQWISPAMRAARDWIKYNTTLLPGFSFQLSFPNTKCSASEAVTDFGKALMSGSKPDLVVGYGW